MNKYGETLYNNLLRLCNKSTAFYYKDFTKNDKVYRIFNYRLSSYSDFADNESALECRGITFRIDNGSVQLVSMPMEKFFNLYENPFTESIDYNNIDFVMEKLDGSLISTVVDGKSFFFKSKGSLFSEQAIAANSLVSSNKEVDLLIRSIMWLYDYQCTINLEYTAPTNRIVVPYQDESLRILNIRSHVDGRYIGFDEVYDLLETIPQFIDFPCRWVNLYKSDEFEDIQTFIDGISTMGLDESEPVIEGFVIQMKDGQKIKVKTERYMKLHRTKDDITNPKRLFESVLYELTDDLRSLFHYDQYLLDLISEMEMIVEPLYNSLVDRCEEYYNQFKHLDRKEFAIKAKEDLPHEFHILINKYINRDVCYKEFMMKNIKYYIGDLYE